MTGGLRWGVEPICREQQVASSSYYEARERVPSARERLCEIGAVPSIGTVGDSYDNAMAESMMGTFKTELYRNPAVLRRVGGHWKGLGDLEVETCAWVSWFNEERLHSELGDVTPSEFEERYGHQSQALAA